MTRYFKVGDNTLGTAGDDADIMALYPGDVEELTEAEWKAASAALSASVTAGPEPVDPMAVLLKTLVANGTITDEEAKAVNP